MIGHGSGRLLPPSVRSLIQRLRQRVRLRNPLNLAKHRPLKRFSGEHVAVAGLFSTSTGLGRAAELVALTLEHRGHRVSRVNISEALGLHDAGSDKVFLRPSDCAFLDISAVVFVINPDHAAPSAFDAEWLLQRCVVGHWIWELDTAPSFWRHLVVSYDEIWAPTELVADVIRDNISASGRPVEVVPYGVDLDPMPLVTRGQREDSRSRMGLSTVDFVAGYSFAVDSNYYRKNPEDAVRMFRLAFPSSEDVSARLLLRCKDLANRPAERARLEGLIGSDPRISIFDAHNSIGIVDFYAALDIYVSTSRSEGYGLNLVEAYQAGLAVVTCGWRIAPEITRRKGVLTTGFELIKINDPQGHYAGISGARWAAPDIQEMADILTSYRNGRAIADSGKAPAKP